MTARVLMPDAAGLERAVAALRAGELVAIPTETVYGLAGLALDAEALARIFAAKGRPTFDPLIAHVAPAPRGGRLAALSAAGLVDLAAMTAAARTTATRLADAFWPGPLTLVLPRAGTVPDLCTSGLPRVAVRMPAHPVAQALLQALGQPLAAPSANRFGRISPTTAAHVSEELADRIGWIVDGGPCAIGVESTVVAVEPDGACVLLRPGGVSREALAGVAGVPVHQPSATSPTELASPGLLASHYAPERPLTLLPGPLDDAGVRALLAPGDAVLVHDGASPLPPGVQAEVLSPDGSDVTAAQRLFACLRALDASGAARLWAEPVTARDGLWPAIADRLTRAAAPRT
jgi:L-threonylcarbamoyladenylate synthase